ncbi:MAG: YciI family protein [Kofleriaceae bacterium]
MKFMMIIKSDARTEAGAMPSEQMLAAMGKYNEELVKAGVLLDASGLHPSAKGAKVQFSGGKRTVIDGPFSESKELIAGFWMLQVPSKEEAIAWARRVPFEADEHGSDAEVELRQVFEMEDFGPSPAVERMVELAEENQATRPKK